MVLPGDIVTLAISLTPPLRGVIFLPVCKHVKPIMLYYKYHYNCCAYMYNDYHSAMGFCLFEKVDLWNMLAKVPIISYYLRGTAQHCINYLCKYYCLIDCMNKE